jgi:L-arabinose isomerase
MKGTGRRLRVGVAGIGLDAYWPQFAGLEERLIGYLRALENKIAGDKRTIVNLGLVDTPEKSLEAGPAAGVCDNLCSLLNGPSHH